MNYRLSPPAWLETSSCNCMFWSVVGTLAHPKSVDLAVSEPVDTAVDADQFWTGVPDRATS